MTSAFHDGVAVHHVGVEKLTPMERGVVRWMSLGKSAEDVAVILGKTPETIKVIVLRLHGKLKEL